MPEYFSDFNKLAEVVLAYRSSKPVLVALHYDLFSHIATGKDTPARLGRKLGLDLKALEVLLDALAALGFLAKSGRRYRNSRLASRFLVDSSPDYLGSNLKYQELTWDAWSDLRFVLKTGKPRRGLLDWIRRDFFTPDYVKAMGDVAREPAQDLARRMDWTGVGRMLDIGCGAGSYSAAFVERAPGLSAVLVDLPRTLNVTRGLLKGHRHGRRLSFREADYLTESLGEDEFDLALLSNVTHVEDEATNRMLVAKAVRALKSGGRLVIHDFVVSEDRTGPRFPALLGLHLLLFTGKGAVYSIKDYSGWMRQAGLGSIVSLPVARESLHPSTAIIGVKVRP